MKIAVFVHAIASCWNNDSAHFLRGVAAELQKSGHDVVFCEPQHSWSERNLIRDQGAAALDQFRQAFPWLQVIKYSPEAPDLDRLTHGADLVVVHEWNSPSLVSALGRKRQGGSPFVLLLYDTYRRQLAESPEMADSLGDYDGVLAAGAALADEYRRRNAAHRAWIWHEAADNSLFHPRMTNRTEGDLVWFGDWGDERRTAELEDLMLEPIEALGLFANLYGARCPGAAVQSLAARGIAHHGWIANHQVPEVFARHRLAVHLPSWGSRRSLRGIPGIRIFEALACGIPLIAAKWNDAEKLFPKGSLLVARNGHEMQNHLRDILSDPALAQSLRESGLKVIREQHTCRHRALELLDIYVSIKRAGTLGQPSHTAPTRSPVRGDVLFPAVGVRPGATTVVS